MDMSFVDLCILYDNKELQTRFATRTNGILQNRKDFLFVVQEVVLYNLFKVKLYRINHMKFRFVVVTLLRKSRTLQNN